MKNLFWLLMPYINKRYRPGKGIRWILQDERGKTPYCFCCGNYANVVGVVRIGKQVFHLPICKTHTYSWMNTHYPDGWDITAPCAINIRPKLAAPKKGDTLVKS